MPFCSLCSSLDFSAICRKPVDAWFTLIEIKHPNYSEFFYNTTDNNLRQGELTAHYDSLTRLSASAESCQFCHLIQNSIDGFVKDSDDYELWLGGRNDVDGFQILGRDRTGTGPSYCLMGGVGFCLRDDSRLKHTIPRRMVPVSPSSPPVLGMIKGWIKECTEAHQHIVPQATFMPTRLLEITDFGRQINLHLPGTKQSRYAVLSHCWGPMMPTTLTSHSIHRLQAGIRTEELSRTLQDAIWLTHQLEIQFLWIDSLCIIQDDPDDWAQESARMHDIYNNSFVTIAASRAANSSEGFLRNRIEKTYVSIPFHREGIAGEVLAFPLPLNHVGNPKRIAWMEYEPLSRRGWALQERHLSRRTLHFASDQIFFECEKLCLAEDTFHSRRYPSVSGTTSSEHFQRMDRDECLREWYSLVEMYAMRQLTFEEDKLPALSGLAAHFSKQRSAQAYSMDLSNRYLAGLWSDDILRGLCWASHAAQVRPTTYRAPSWSWASLDGRVRYFFLHRMGELAVVEKAHVDLESPTRSFGKVLGGWVSIKVIKLLCHADAVDNLGYPRFSEDSISFYIYTLLDQASADSRRRKLLAIMRETEVLVVPLGWSEDRNQNGQDIILGPVCLILKRVNPSTATPTYQRIGFGVVRGEKLEEDNGGTNNLELKRRIIGKWAMAKQQGNLETIVIT